MTQLFEDSGFGGWQAKWIAKPVEDHRRWERYALEANVAIEASGMELLVGLTGEDSYTSCALDAADGVVRLYVMKDGERRELGEAPASELASAAGVRIEQDETKLLRVCLNGRVALEASVPEDVRGTIGFQTGRGGRAVVRELRVFDAEGRALHANRFYDPSITQFTAGEIDRSGNGLRLEENTLAVCESPLPVDNPLFRKVFELPKGVVRATARVYAVGWYELRINGGKADDRVLAPANAPYERRLLYDVYDITEQVRQGDNAIGLWLGNGYNHNYSRYGWKWRSGKSAIVQLDVQLADGRLLHIVTDETWRTTEGPLLQNDIYDGETLDGRLAPQGWDDNGFDDSSWKAVVLAQAPGGRLEPNSQPPIRTHSRLRPVRKLHDENGVTVYDFGQNISGWASILARGAAGARITLRYSELVDADGRIDPWTNRNARATDAMILRGEGEEAYEPRFTYHGFRYVEVSGDAELLSLEAVPIHADVAEAGRFDCSDELLNRIQSNLRWSILNNLVAIPTDCCQRDERTPCQMDSAVVEEAAIHNFGMRAYYWKWLVDIEDSATNPDWSGDKITLPWYLYLYYGDEEALRLHYAPMLDYMDHLAKKWPEGIVEEGFGDWCPPNEDGWENYFREVAIVNTALYYRQACVTADTAAVLGRTADEERCRRLAESIRDAFHERFYRGGGVYGSGTQTAQLMPLAFGMTPQAEIGQVVARLTEEIASKGNHVDTGIYGTRYLLDVLAEHGYIDLAFEMLTKTDYPSFGWQIAQGATTLWEQWSFKGGMHSHDHAMFGGIGASFYTCLAGVNPLEPGYRRFSIKPYIPQRLERARAELETAQGRIVSAWRKEGSQLIFEIEVPDGSTAEILLPLPGGGRDSFEAGPGRHQYSVAL